MFGFWPWSGERLVFPHKLARKVRYVGQAWESHIKAVVEPALRFWWPGKRTLHTKKNNQGVDYFMTDSATGSTLEIMSNIQASDVFEGWEGDVVIYDEPPRRDVRVACARGLIDRQGRELFCATLLKEAWVHREVIKARLEDGKPDPTVFNITGKIYDNVGYGITQAGVDQFRKTLRAEERDARLEGTPSYMITLVFPVFRRERNVVKPFTVPLDAIVDVSIDFHPSKPWAVLFLATMRNNFKYCVHEIWEHGNPKYIGEKIVRVIRDNHFRTGRVVIDPLAKSGEPNDNDVFRVVSDVLGSHYLNLEVASKDKDSGIALVNDLLLTENQMPGLFFFDTCPKTIQQVEDLMYDPDSLKPTAIKTEDDFTECLYRLVLLNTQWFPEKVYDVNQQVNVMV